MHVTTVGLDLAKNVFQVHGITDGGEVAFNRSLRRTQMLSFFEKLEPCVVGMEACSTSHHWARELTRLGHTVRLIPPSYVKPYVKRGKSDAADAEAICEAVTRPTMRFVEVKSCEQQAILSLHRTRDLIVRQRTQTINMLRGLLAEFGIVLPKGVGYAVRFARQGRHEACAALQEHAHGAISDLCDAVVSLHERVASYSRQIAALAKDDPNIARLQTIPGVWPITASATTISRSEAASARSAERGTSLPHPARSGRATPPGRPRVEGSGDRPAGRRSRSSPPPSRGGRWPRGA